MAGLMDDLVTQLGMMAPMAQERQKTDEFGVSLPPEPGQQAQQQMDPNMIRMLMQMLMSGQGQQGPQAPPQGMPGQMPGQGMGMMPQGGRGF